MTKGTFLDPLISRAYAKGEWVLMTDLRYHALDGRLCSAPKYFITDLASVPWSVKPFFDNFEDREAGVIHDWLYCQNPIPRVIGDVLFYEMLRVLRADKR